MHIRLYEGSIPDRVYMDATNLHVSNYIIYVKEEQAYYDAKCEFPITAKDLADLYVKGLVILSSGWFYTPISMRINESTTVIAYHEYNTSTHTIMYSIATGTDQEPEPGPDPEPDQEPEPGPDPEPEPENLSLLTLSLDDVSLVPAFDGEVFNYTATVSEASSELIFTVSDDSVDVVVKLNNQIVSDYEAIIWEETTNVLTITLGNENPAIVYTITVTVDI